MNSEKKKDRANKKQGMDLILLLILSSVSFTPDLKGLDESYKIGLRVRQFQRYKPMSAKTRAPSPRTESS